MKYWNVKFLRTKDPNLKKLDRVYNPESNSCKTKIIRWISKSPSSIKYLRKLASEKGKL